MTRERGKTAFDMSRAASQDSFAVLGSGKLALNSYAFNRDSLCDLGGLTKSARIIDTALYVSTSCQIDQERCARDSTNRLWAWAV